MRHSRNDQPGRFIVSSTSFWKALPDSCGRHRGWKTKWHEQQLLSPRKAKTATQDL
jgi:hypothetical protein